MDRVKAMKLAEALNMAIWLNMSAGTLSKEELHIAVKEISTYNLFSSRQLSAIVSNVIDHSTIAKLIKKENKTGGNLNVATLEILRSILYSRSDGRADYQLVSEALEKGTSQGMISRLTGISQSSISRRLSKNG